MNPAVLPENVTFNHAAAAENQRNMCFVTLTHGGGITALSVNSKQATYKGIKVVDLSYDMKRKFENILLFSFLPKLKQIPKIIYV